MRCAAKMLYVAAVISTVLSSALFASCDDDKKTTETPLSDAEKSELLERAYVYALPLMLMDATYVKMTNTVDTVPQQSPANRFIHARKLANAKFKDVVTPNSDTNYSQVMMDLSGDALVVRLPRTDRFCMAEILDAWSNCIAAPDATKIPDDKEYGDFVFVGPSFTGTVPEGMTVIKSPTNHVWMLLRTLCKGEDDLPNVIAIQNQMKTYLLSDYLNGEVEYAGKGTYDPANNFTPVKHILGMSMTDFFTRANALMITNPPAEADAQWIAALSKIGVGPGLTFDASIFGSNATALWRNLVSNIMNITQPRCMQFVKDNGSWRFYGEPIAEFGTEYYYRAMIAVAALAANPVSIAVYPRADLDQAGDTLNGNHRYLLHIEKENWPETNAYGFWSITMYDKENFFYDNELDRYNITDRSDFVKNQDGSLDILIQHEKPAENVSNWLPAPDDKFHLYFRIYNPVERIIKNEWDMPTITRLD